LSFTCRYPNLSLDIRSYTSTKLSRNVIFRAGIWKKFESLESFFYF